MGKISGDHRFTCRYQSPWRVRVDQAFELLQEYGATRLHFAGDTANKIDQTLAINHFFAHVGRQQPLI